MLLCQNVLRLLIGRAFPRLILAWIFCERRSRRTIGHGLFASIIPWLQAFQLCRLNRASGLCPLELHLNRRRRFCRWKFRESCSRRASSCR